MEDLQKLSSIELIAFDNSLEDTIENDQLIQATMKEISFRFNFGQALDFELKNQKEIDKLTAALKLKK